MHMSGLVAAVILFIMILPITSCQKCSDSAQTKQITVTTPEGYDHSASGGQNGFALHWKIVGETLKVQLESPKKGYIAVGLDPKTGMQEADIAIGYMKDGKPHVEDHFGNGFYSHRQDVDLGGQNNASEAGGKETDSGLILSFSRPLAKSDAQDKPVNLAGEDTVILAYGGTTDISRVHIFWARLKVNWKSGKSTIEKTR